MICGCIIATGEEGERKSGSDRHAAPRVPTGTDAEPSASFEFKFFPTTGDASWVRENAVTTWRSSRPKPTIGVYDVVLIDLFAKACLCHTCGCAAGCRTGRCASSWVRPAAGAEWRLDGGDPVLSFPGRTCAGKLAARTSHAGRAFDQREGWRHRGQTRFVSRRQCRLRCNGLQGNDLHRGRTRGAGGRDRSRLAN